jgi:hypothetical protein
MAPPRYILSIDTAARSFAKETMRSTPFRLTKSVAQAYDSPREPEWSRGAFWGR